MNNYLQSIINKYNEFNTYLKEINIKDFKQFTRDELIQFKKELPSYFSFRYLTSEINDIIEKKKLQEYPELLGVHHYPEIKELTCISEEDKIKLDNFLVEWGLNSYLHEHTSKFKELFKYWSKEITNKVFDFLVDKNILKRYYKLYICCDYIIIDKEKINKYLRYFELNKKLNEISTNEKLFNWDIESEWDKLERELNYFYEYCPECYEEIRIKEELIMETINKPSYFYKVIKERDKTYDKL